MFIPLKHYMVIAFYDTGNGIDFNILKLFDKHAFFNARFLAP